MSCGVPAAGKCSLPQNFNPATYQPFSTATSAHTTTRSAELLEAEALLAEKDEALLAAYESLTTACKERAGLRAQLVRVRRGEGGAGAGPQWEVARARANPANVAGKAVLLVGGGWGGVGVWVGSLLARKRGTSS